MDCLNKDVGEIVLRSLSHHNERKKTVMEALAKKLTNLQETVNLLRRRL